jgi:hypothetical protein
MVEVGLDAHSSNGDTRTIEGCSDKVNHLSITDQMNVVPVQVFLNDSVWNDVCDTPREAIPGFRGLRKREVPIEVQRCEMCASPATGNSARRWTD